MMKNKVKLLPNGRSINLRLFMAEEIEKISALPPDAAGKQLDAILTTAFRQHGAAASKAAIMTAALNRPELLRNKAIWDLRGIWGTIVDVLEANLRKILRHHRYDAEAVTPFLTHAIVTKNTTVARQLFSLRAQFGLSPVTRAQSRLDFMAITPIAYRDKDPQLGASGKRAHNRLIIADPSVDEAFLVDSLKDTIQSSVHFFGDLDGLHRLPAVLGGSSRIVGCRDAVSRYDKQYVGLFQECKKTSEMVASLVAGDEDLVSKVSLDKTTNALELMICDRLFFGAYFVLCVLDLAARKDFDDIVFLLGENSTLWNVAKLVSAAGPGNQHVRYAAPSFAQAKRQASAAKLLLLREENWPSPDLTNDAAFGIDKEANQEIGRLIRYFAHCANFRSDGRGRALAASDSEKNNRRIVCASGNHPAYFEAIAHLHVRLVADKQFDPTFYHLGPNPSFTQNELSRIAFEVGPVGEMIAPTILDAHTPQKSDNLNVELGRWLFRRYGAQIIKSMRKLADGNNCKKATFASLTERIEHIFSYDVGLFLANVSFYQALLDTGRPSVIVVSPSRSVEAMALVGVGARLGIKSYALDVHILDAKYPRNTKIYTDRVGVISEYFASEYSARFGVERERVDVLGSLRLGLMTDAVNGHTKTTVRSELDLVKSDNVILLATQPIRWGAMENCLQRIMKGFAALPEDTTIILKLHREEGRERLERYMSMLRQFGLASRTVCLNVDIQSLILASDCVVTLYSTTAMEASALGKPVIVVPPEHGNWPTDWSDLGVAVSARTSADIAEAIGKALSGQHPIQQSPIPAHSADTIIGRLMEVFNEMSLDETPPAGGTMKGGLYVDYIKPDHIVA